MSEEKTTSSSTPSDVPKTEAPSIPTKPTSPPVPETPAIDPEKYLDLSDRQKARAHPWVSGLIGFEVEKARRTERERIDSEQLARDAAAAEASRTAERDRLRNLRRTDPLAYAQEMDDIESENERAESLAKLRGETRDTFARRIGAALNDIPEWAELSEETRRTELAQALAGKGDDDALGAFVSTAVRLVTGHISQKQFDAKFAQAQKDFDDRLAKDVAREREAIRREEAAKSLAADRRPEMGRGTPAPTRSKLDTLPIGEDFNREYERTVLARR